MKRIPIDLSLPLESVLTQALALPTGGHNVGITEAEVEQAVRCLFAAAQGRSVETPIGRISIAPAIAPWLKTAPLPIRTRGELLTLAGLNPAGKPSTADLRPRNRDERDRTPPAHFQNLDAAAHFKPGTALQQFMAGRLGAPSCWPASRYPRRVVDVPNETPWIHRWENEGGRTLAEALPKDRAPSRLYFHPMRPLLTQLI